MGTVMKALAFFGGAGMLTSTVAGGEMALVLGNLAVIAAAAALFLATVNLNRAAQ